VEGWLVDWVSGIAKEERGRLAFVADGVQHGKMKALGMDFRGARRGLTTGLAALLCLFCLIAGSAAASPERFANTDASSSASTGPGLPFTVADLDGDQRPDVANVQASQNSAGESSYWIRLALTGSGRQLIRLSGPSGGLQIEARDVNGDASVDLILATSWLHRPVAVLLNDGHGKFSNAEPSYFLDAIRGSNQKFDERRAPSTETLAAPSESPRAIAPTSSNSNSAQPKAARNDISRSDLLFDVIAILPSDRAPPTNLLL